MLAAAAAAGEEVPSICPVEVSAGSVVFHHGLTWHGSESNPPLARSRRAIALHYLSRETRFANDRGGYIYGRYKKPASDALEDCFFPPLA
jgi:ectoine hydroxylase-related dioxygenase (phytanoyl-CoA dioxygenase family)